ncbi:MAG: acetolactate decarboxylase [Candidatus Gracilibacteria bacterium]|nr:acetolactate decarboxylase [Candidatus Gracilibacteria bacterium]
MENKKTIEAIRDFIMTAEKSIKNANKLLKDVLEKEGVALNSPVSFDASQMNSYMSDDSKIVEGVFTGEDMLGSDGSSYPVPANYSSKSKLVQGDKLKLTIAGNGKMLYKQIAPIQREIKAGLLTKEKETYQVISDGTVYDVLTAAVTHFKAEIGDNISIIVPEGKAATFAAIDSVIPAK